MSELRWDDEKAVRNHVWTLCLRSRVLQRRSREIAARGDALRRGSRATLAEWKRIVRRSRWLLSTKKRLPKIVPATRAARRT